MDGLRFWSSLGFLTLRSCFDALSCRFLAVPSQFTSCRHFLDFCARFASGLRSPFRLKNKRLHVCAHALTTLKRGRIHRHGTVIHPTREDCALIPILCPRSPQRSGHRRAERQRARKYTAEKEKPTQSVFEGLQRGKRNRSGNTLFIGRSISPKKSCNKYKNIC